MCLTGAFSDMQKYRHNYNSCTTTTAHILTIVKYRKAFMMQVQKDALTSAASFSCVQLVRHFQEEHFNRFSCVLFPKLLTLIAAPNTLNLEPAFSLFPFCRGRCCLSGQSFLFSMLDRVFRVGDLHLRRTMVGMGWRFRLIVLAQAVLHLDEVVQ